jgi:hypothetical protein
MNTVMNGIRVSGLFWFRLVRILGKNERLHNAKNVILLFFIELRKVIAYFFQFFFLHFSAPIHYTLCEYIILKCEYCK